MNNNMENVKTLMQILDKYNHQMTDGDYLKGCDSVKSLYLKLSQLNDTKYLTLNNKVIALLHKLNEVNPDFTPIITTPYTHEHLQHLEWICRKIYIDPEKVYEHASEQLYFLT